MTAIASGLGSLFGSGKLKELEQANGKLQGKIDKRDNQIRLLNEHMRMQKSVIAQRNTASRRYTDRS